MVGMASLNPGSAGVSQSPGTTEMGLEAEAARTTWRWGGAGAWVLGSLPGAW